MTHFRCFDDLHRIGQSPWCDAPSRDVGKLAALTVGGRA
jgi:hypothetical protein